MLLQSPPLRRKALAVVLRLLQRLRQPRLHPLRLQSLWQVLVPVAPLVVWPTLWRDIATRVRRDCQCGSANACYCMSCGLCRQSTSRCGTRGPLTLPVVASGCHCQSTRAGPPASRWCRRKVLRS